MNNTRVIKDPDIRNALDTLITEIENLESSVKEKDKETLDLERRIEELESDVYDLVAKVKELEEALAEAYLTSEILKV